MKGMFAAVLAATQLSPLAAEGVPHRVVAPNAGAMVLVAKRALKDRIYSKTVLIVRSVGNDRHVGLIINRPSRVTLGKLFPNHAASRLVTEPVRLGGPMGPEVIFALLRDSANPGGRSIEMFPGVFFAYDSAIVDKIIETKSAKATFFAGMVVWKPGELAQELKRGLWFVQEPAAELLTKPAERLWDEAIVTAEQESNTI